MEETVLTVVSHRCKAATDLEVYCLQSRREEFARSCSWVALLFLFPVETKTISEAWPGKMKVIGP